MCLKMLNQMEYSRQVLKKKCLYSEQYAIYMISRSCILQVACWVTINDCYLRVILIVPYPERCELSPIRFRHLSPRRRGPYTAGDSSS